MFITRAVTIACLVFFVGQGFCYSPNNVVTPSANAIASAHPLATKAGMKIMRQGGNAFDAAIAVMATLAVVSPYHSGIGGGGFVLVHEAKTKKNIFIDAREVAPAKAHTKMYLDDKGNVIENASLIGPLAAGIPGEPAAIVYLSKHFGRLSLAQDLAPAIELAERGFKLDQQFIDFLLMRNNLANLNKYPSSKAVFTDNGKRLTVGHLFVQKDLARTLKHIAKEGNKGFYQGETAKELVDSVTAAGGVWTLADLANYRVKIRNPLIGHYQNTEIITAPPPSAGGISLITMLNILQAYWLQEQTQLHRIHYIIEAMRLAFWDRANYMGDPDFVSIPVKELTSTKHAAYLRKFIHADKATPSDTLPNGKYLKPGKSANTTHFSILDTQGNRVAATVTVNYIFGSSFVAGKTGVLLNDEMDDFSTKPGSLNVFGLIGNKENEIQPGKRPVSSMSPTFLVSKQRIAILGTPGGSRIPTMILLATLEYMQFKGVVGMVSALRYHHQFVPDVVQFEPGAFSALIQKQLTKMGYHLYPLDDYYGDMQLVEWNRTNNIVFAASDPRHVGLAVVDSSPQRIGYGVNH